jgi:hypothetical protein
LFGYNLDAYTATSVLIFSNKHIKNNLAAPNLKNALFISKYLQTFFYTLRKTGASVPLTSVLAIIWLYQDTKDTNNIIDLSYNIFWLVLPSLLFFIVFPLLLKANLNFYLSLFISLVLMISAYFAMVFILEKVGYKI